MSFRQASHVTAQLVCIGFNEPLIIDVAPIIFKQTMARKTAYRFRFSISFTQCSQVFNKFNLFQNLLKQGQDTSSVHQSQSQRILKECFYIDFLPAS